MKSEERFVKMVFGGFLVMAFFVSWGKWLALGLGVLFLISAAWGICWSCYLKKFLGQTTKVTIKTRSKS